MHTIDADVVVIGAGHNGLVAAALLAEKNLKVVVVEERAAVGGAAKTERPFKKAPGLGTSTGAYLLGVMPPELIARLGIEIPLVRRDPHYFLPTIDGRYLLFGSDRAAMKDQFLRFFSAEDWAANDALQTELAMLRDDLAPSWLAEPLPVGETAARYIRPALRDVFVNLVTGPAEDYLGRFAFKSELLVAMYAVTDAFSGLTGSFATPGTGMNFLVHNMCRLPGSDGTFMIVRGGMGTVTQRLAERARKNGTQIMTDAPVAAVRVEQGSVRGVTLRDGRELRAKVVMGGCDPFKLRALVGASAFSPAFNARLDGMKRLGTTMKVNLALSRLPTFSCLPENRRQHDATIHLLPEDSRAGGKGVIAKLGQSFADAEAGRLPDFPSIEWYIHSQADPSLSDDQGRHNAAFFVQWVPNQVQGSSWEREEAGYVDHLLSIAERFAPGFKDSVVDTFVLTPPKIEAYFGISHGHIHHVDNTLGFDQRMPYATEIAGLYACSAGCHPAGSVIGAAGYNAAMRVMGEMR